MIELALFCRNEAPRVHGAIRALRAQAHALPRDLLPLRVVVLENGSTDDTAEVAERAAREFADDIFVVEVRSGLPPGKTRSWNAFLERATAEILVFMDADVIAAPGAIAMVVDELRADPGSDLVSAIPRVPPEFRASGFWQSVFAVPYYGLRPAESVTGNLYAARRDRLRPLDPDILHEDLALSLRHEGAFRVSGRARVFVTPPPDFRGFVRQRVRCLRADMTEERRFGKDVAPHRRREIRDFADFLRTGGPVRLGAFMLARLLATVIARFQGPQNGGEWLPEAGR